MSGGASAGQTKGSSRTDSSFSGTSKPIIPDYWSNTYQGALNNLGNDGVNSFQNGIINNLGDISKQQNAYTQAGYYSLADLSKNFGGEWATPTNVTAQPVTAQTGASFMDAYKNPFDKDVIDASVADYNASADRALNGLRAGRDASGAFGDRSSLADAQFNADATRGLGSLVSGLRQQGFNTAAGYGQSDANRFLQADSTNAANRLAADTFNNNLTNNRQQFSVNEALQGDQNRMQAFRDMRDTALAQSGVASGGLTQLINLLNTGTNTFGQQQDGSSTSTSVNGSKSKGGGVSGPIPI